MKIKITSEELELVMSETHRQWVNTSGEKALHGSNKPLGSGGHLAVCYMDAWAGLLYRKGLLSEPTSVFLEENDTSPIED